MLFALLAGPQREPIKDNMDETRLIGLMERHGDRVLRIAYSYLKDYGRAEDICQEVFLKLYCINKHFEDEGHETAFILRMTINLCKDQYKGFWHKRVVVGEEKEITDDDEPGQIVAETDEARQLFSVVSGLDNAFKSVVILFYYEGLSSKEIAQVLNIPQATVRSRLKRAREKLKKKLKDVGVHEA